MPTPLALPLSQFSAATAPPGRGARSRLGGGGLPSASAARRSLPVASRRTAGQLPARRAAAPGASRRTARPVTCRSGKPGRSRNQGSAASIISSVTEEIQDIIAEAPRRPERAVALLVGLAGATMFIGPLLGTIGFASVIAGTAIMSSMAFGGMMMAFGMMMATFFTFGFLSMFGTMFGVFVLPSLVPLLFVGGGAALFFSASRRQPEEGPDTGASESRMPTESAAERAARLEVEKIRQQEAERQKEVAEELKAFDTLLKSRTKDINSY